MIKCRLDKAGNYDIMIRGNIPTVRLCHPVVKQNQDILF